MRLVGWYDVGCWQARRGDVEVLSALIRRGANLEAPDENGDTALVVASRKADCDVALMLLDYGAYVPCMLPPIRFVPSPTSLDIDTRPHPFVPQRCFTLAPSPV
jgi:hypothetical protein